jgi:hypothetical protein
MRSPNGCVDRLAISSDPDESSAAARKIVAGKSKAMPHASAIARNACEWPKVPI